MRNYFAVLTQNRLSTTAELETAISALTAEELALEDDLQSVLSSELQKTHYTRVHLQYDAMAAVMARQSSPLAENSHLWDRRLVEFEVTEDAIEPGDNQ